MNGGTWIPREALERALTVQLANLNANGQLLLGRLTSLLDSLERKEGEIAFQAEWEKLSRDDPRMDEVERSLFPDETYRCSHCGRNSVFGANCTKDRYCQTCGARMRNAGRRET